MNLPFRSLLLAAMLLVAPFAVSAQTVIWAEDFTYPDGTTTGPSGEWTALPCTTCSASTDWFEVRNNALEARDVNDWVSFETQVINIAGCDAEFSLRSSEVGDHDSPSSATGINIDYFDVYYSIDGGPFTVIEDWNGDGEALHTLTGDSNNGVFDDGDWVNTVITQIGLTGNTLQLRVNMRNTSDDERMQLDDISVTCNILPVEYLHFAAEKQSDHVLLTWETAQESNNDYFELQRSPNGSTFYSVAQIDGAGTSDVSQGYQFRDFAQGGASTFYRLKQVDFNGQASYSKVVEVVAANASLDLLGLYPQPATESVQARLLVPHNGTYQLNLLDLNGRPVMNRALELNEGTQEISLDLNGISGGLYLLRLSDGVSNLSRRLVVR